MCAGGEVARPCGRRHHSAGAGQKVSEEDAQADVLSADHPAHCRGRHCGGSDTALEEMMQLESELCDCGTCSGAGISDHSQSYVVTFAVLTAM